MGVHALLSPSSSKQWLNCPPSIRFCEDIAEKDESVYAKEGTLAHTVAETYLLFYLEKMTKRQFTFKINKLKKEKLFSDEMIEHAKGYANYIIEGYTDTDLYAFYIENKVDYSTYVPEGFGFVDCISIVNDTLKIIDYKYGKGVQVDAYENTQLMLYALGAFLELGFLYDIRNVEMSIYQPRLDNISTFKMDINDLLSWAENELSVKAKLAYEGAGSFKSGEHCRWCKAKGFCKTRAKQNIDLYENNSKNINQLSFNDIGSILPLLDDVKRWVEDIKAFALNSLSDGNKIDGYKLVEGRSNRTYSSENDIIETLANVGYKDDEIFEKSILGISKMEKLLGKKQFNELLSDYIVKPPGKPTLVPVSDKREEINTASDDFKDICI